ncbi:hypothetical protein KFE25_003111 [Diacronema lutheri]|uniref:Strictosidine synthase conserved region domain-containing protein n=2 Tax=Diacronema lutheri TaxID=2081491 RepID=A0A8J5X1S4_DIALT|nr:hypothetical protein KFE25_003111 [Diacronema lutheri]
MDPRMRTLHRVMLAAALGGTFLFTMPDGSGPVLALRPELVALQHAAAGKLAPVLARDPEQRLRACARHASGQIHGPETVAAPARNGSLYLINRDNAVRRADPAAGGSYALARGDVAHLGPGRAGGNVVDGERLLVADDLKGLVELDLRTGRASLLTPRHSANDLDLHPSDPPGRARILFSRSTVFPILPARGAHSAYDAMDWYVRCALRGDATGGLYEYNAATLETTELLAGLAFANGAAYSADGAFALVAESSAFRVLRVWLRGANAGAVETFAQGLPGFPDGISRSADGHSFWLAIVAPYSPVVPLLRFRLVRGLLARARPLLNMLKRPLGLVLQLRASDGELIAVYADARGDVVTRADEP